MIKLNTDASLVRRVYREQIGDLLVTAMLSRFGDLVVFVWGAERVALWQGDNVLAARRWALHRATVKRSA